MGRSTSTNFSLHDEITLWQSPLIKMICDQLFQTSQHTGHCPCNLISMVLQFTVPNGHLIFISLTPNEIAINRCMRYSWPMYGDCYWCWLQTISHNNTKHWGLDIFKRLNKVNILFLFLLTLCNVETLLSSLNIAKQLLRTTCIQDGDQPSMTVVISKESFWV